MELSDIGNGTPVPLTEHREPSTPRTILRCAQDRRTTIEAPRTMLISHLSRASGASVRAIRHYEGAGLVRAVRRSNGYREFDEAAVGRVRAIKELMAAGFTVEEVKSLADCLEACPRDHKCSARTAALYRTRLGAIDSQIKTLRLLRQRIEERLSALKG